jgi:hypothetical protein
MTDARGFFQDMKMPDGFFRAKEPFGLALIGGGINFIFAVHPIQPGVNQGINNYVLDPASANHILFALYQLCERDYSVFVPKSDWCST